MNMVHIYSSLYQQPVNLVVVLRVSTSASSLGHLKKKMILKVKFFPFCDYCYRNLSQTVSDYLWLCYYTCDVLVCLPVY